MFVCFAPREDPKIVIAVVVENSGFGGTWAAPIASLMMEKYLNDTIRTERLAKLAEIAAANLLPPYFERLQYIEDSTRAERWSEITGDSTRLKKYLRRGAKPPAPAPKKSDSLPPNQLGVLLLPEKKNPVKSPVNRSR